MTLTEEKVLSYHKEETELKGGLNEDQKRRLSKLEGLVEEVNFNLYYSENPEHQEIKQLLTGFQEEGIEFVSVLKPYLVD